MFYKIGAIEKFTGKYLLESCNFIKKDTLAQVFSCEFCEISKNTFFTEHLWATAFNGSIVCDHLASDGINLSYDGTDVSCKNIAFLFEQFFMNKVKRSSNYLLNDRII